MRGLAGMIDDDTSLLLLRLVVFSTFPMIMALQLARRRKIALTRHTLREPFYAQCYAAGPFALVLGLGAMATQLHDARLRIAGVAVMAAALLWFGTVQALWFARTLNVSLPRGFWIASLGMVQCLAVIFAVAPLLT